MNNLERLENEWLEPDDNEPEWVGECEECGQDFYEGDEYVDVNGEMVCNEVRCLIGYIGGTVKDAELED